MFNIGPLEFAVLAGVALVVFGPDKLPQLVKDASRMIRTLRDMAQGARTQLTSELGPEFANFDVSSLNPKTAIRNALLGDEDYSALNPRDTFNRILRGEDDAPAGAAPLLSDSPTARPTAPGPNQTAAPTSNSTVSAPAASGPAASSPAASARAASGGQPDRPISYDSDAT